jgi:hypothetical protein
VVSVHGGGFGRYAAFAHTPPYETRWGLAVEHPRYPLLPKIGMSAAPLLLFAATFPVLRRQISEGWDFDLIDALFLSGRDHRRAPGSRSRPASRRHSSGQRCQHHRGPFRAATMDRVGGSACDRSGVRYWRGSSYL